MSTIRIGYRNLADEAVLSASTQIGTKPVSLLQDPHVGARWSAGRSSAWIDVLWPEPMTVDCVALMGVDLTEGGRFRLRSPADGAARYDSGDRPARVDPAYGYLVHVLPAPVTTRSLHLGLADPAVSDLRAGRLFAGLLWAPSWGDSYGRKLGYAPASTQTVGRGGQTFVDRRGNPRAAQFQLDGLTEAETRTHLRVLQRRCGNTDDVLVIFDADDPNPGEVTVWGLLKELQLPSLDRANATSNSFNITERL
jgi:hypothetical protein